MRQVRYCHSRGTGNESYAFSGATDEAMRRLGRYSSGVSFKCSELFFLRIERGGRHSR